MSKQSVKESLVRIIDGKGDTHLEKKRHRFLFIMTTGIILTIIVALMSICIGQTKVMGPFEALGNLFSAIGKGGKGLTNDEVLIYSSRFPRTVAAIGVGLGLSVAGAAYQAIIRNPLVDPYIMGVSAGSGTFAIATIAFGFSFFGLLSSHSPYLTAVSAAVGGLLAFGLTMLVAIRAGRTTNAYVLSGVVVGLLFSAIQTVLIKFSGDKIQNSMSWLFGSFANVRMDEAMIILVGVLVLSIVILRMSRELNLVLLGENEAEQMGLNVKKFNMVLLIVASVLASLCVAFVGIIGFVGLVVPHFCRMVFGGDHRLMLPASMLFGGTLMILADLVARMAMSVQELPVGAITTLIGVPVFAYLLVKRGKIYNG